MKIAFILFFMVFVSCKEKVREINSINNELKESTENTTTNKDKKENVVDSVKIISSKFIWYNENSDPKKFVIEEPDIEDFCKNFPSESKKYFPLIRKRYPLDFNEDFFLRCYIFLLGDASVFEDIDFSKLNDEQKRIVELNFRNFNISIQQNK